MMRSSDLTDHLDRAAIEAHLRSEHPHIRTDDEPSAAILRGWHRSDHIEAGKPDHDIGEATATFGAR